MGFFTRIKINSLKKKIQSLANKRIEGGSNPEALAKEAKLSLNLANLFEKNSKDKKLANGSLFATEVLRSAASLGDANAQYEMGKRLLEQAKSYESMKETFMESAITEASREGLYKDSIAFITSASDQSHIDAKRLLALVNIHGWGIPVDHNKGLQLIKESIDQEGSWDKASKIFAELKLSPDILSQLMSMK